MSHKVSLKSGCSGVVIVAHQEDTGPLRQVLVSEGFAVDEVRGPYTAEQSKFAAVIRCFVNHTNAWRIAAQRNQPTIIVEADFVPVKGFGKLPIPMPLEQFPTSLAYLYCVGPRIWDLGASHFARGHAGGLVATVISPEVAKMLLQFFEEECRSNPTGEYSPFDAKLGYWLLERGVESYLPYRHYGEHGGIGNPEHATAGLGRPHQADVLWGNLAFLPAYAAGSRINFWRTRIRARIWGVGRLLTMRLVASHDFFRSEWGPMIRFAAGRYLFRKPSRWR